MLSRLTSLLRDQRVAYLAVGGINTGLGFGFFVLFQLLLGDTIGYMGCLVLAYAPALVIAFFLHRRFVFRVQGHLVRDFGRFVLVNLSALGINAVLLPLFHEVVGLPVIAAQLVAMIVTVTSSFFAHRMFSFARDSAVPDGPGLAGGDDHRGAGGQVTAFEHPTVQSAQPQEEPG